MKATSKLQNENLFEGAFFANKTYELRLTRKVKDGWLLTYSDETEIVKSAAETQKLLIDGGYEYSHCEDPEDY